METQNQGGRDGGHKPPQTALGYFGESEDEPECHKNSEVRREKKQNFDSQEQTVALREVGSLSSTGSPFFKFLKAAVAEFRRVNWPTPARVLGHSLFTLSLVSAVSLPLYSLSQWWSQLL